MTKHTLTARIALLLTLAALVPLAAQSGSSGAALLNVGEYSKLFLNNNGLLSRTYIRAANEDDLNKFSALDEDREVIDTPLEIALLSTCAGVIDIRPPEADAILPKNNPRLADTKLGAAAYMEMQAATFLGGDSAPYAAALRFITGRGRVTEADIKGFVRQGIAAEVDKQFKNTLLLPNEIQAVKDILAIFFIKPNITTFNAVRDVDYIYTVTTMSLSGEKKKAYADVMVAYGRTLLSLSPKLSTTVIESLSDLRTKSGADNVVTLANMVRYSNRDIFLPLF
jgi:hypothetical protein